MWCNDMLMQSDMLMCNVLNAYIPIAYDYAKMIMECFCRCLCDDLDGNMKWLWDANEFLRNDRYNAMRCNVMGEMQWHGCTYLWRMFMITYLYDDKNVMFHIWYSYAMRMISIWYAYAIY